MPILSDTSGTYFEVSEAIFVCVKLLTAERCLTRSVEAIQRKDFQTAKGFLGASRISLYDVHKTVKDY